MFDTKDYTLIALSVITSIVANVIYAFPIHLIYISTIVFLGIIIYILNAKLSLIKEIGIKRVEKNISSGTDTEKLLSLVDEGFYMMGRGGSRFVEAKTFDLALSKADRQRPIRFLLLKPDAPAPEELSKERNVVNTHISNIISTSLKTFKQHHSAGYNIEVRFYENPKYVPIFRVVVIDDSKIFVSFYQRRETGKSSFQLELFDPKNNNNLFVAFKLHFETMWAVSEKVNLNEV